MITTDHLMIDRRILLQARTLIQSGHDVRLLAGFECAHGETYEMDGLIIDRFAYDWSDPRVDHHLAKLRVGSEGIRGQVFRFGRRLVSKLTGFTSFENFILKKILEFDFDVLHCHDFPLLKVAVETVRRKPAKLVYDAHELYHAQTQLPSAVQKRYRRIERRLIKKPDLVMTVNPFIADIMSKDYGIQVPHVILNATVKEPRANTDKLRQLTGISSEEHIILYQGWISPERGIEQLLRCASYFPTTIHLVIFGYGAYEDDLRKLSAEQGTNDGRVMFMGPLPNHELAEITPFADLGAIPYHGVDLNNYYCSPNKMFEFIAAGVPFVSNDLPFLRLIAEDYGCAVLVDYEKPDCAADRIVNLLNQSSEIEALKDRTRNASMVLNWNVEARKFLELYAAIL